MTKRDSVGYLVVMAASTFTSKKQAALEVAKSGK
jgi:hypothetical protein